MPRGAKKQFSPIELAQMGLLPYDWDRQWKIPEDPDAVSPTPDEVLDEDPVPKGEAPSSEDGNQR